MNGSGISAAVPHHHPPMGNSVAPLNSRDSLGGSFERLFTELSNTATATIELKVLLFGDELNKVSPTNPGQHPQAEREMGVVGRAEVFTSAAVSRLTEINSDLYLILGRLRG